MCDQLAIENRATSHIQPRPRTRRHIEDEHAPEPVQMEGLVGGETERRGPETGGAENEELQRRQKGEDKAFYYTSYTTNNIYGRNRVLVLKSTNQSDVALGRTSLRGNPEQ